MWKIDETYARKKNWLETLSKVESAQFSRRKASDTAGGQPPRFVISRRGTVGDDAEEARAAAGEGESDVGEAAGLSTGAAAGVDGRDCGVCGRGAAARPVMRWSITCSPHTFFLLFLRKKRYLKLAREQWRVCE